MSDLNRSLATALIDERTRSSTHLRPALVVNNPPNTKVVQTLIGELERCASFSFSVAFITVGGLASILQALYDATLHRGVKGRILTSDYLSFTDPRALQTLLEYFSSSIEVRISSHPAFHTKGYLFERTDGLSTLLVGSSNLTQSALSTNEEWNVRLVSQSEGELTKRTYQEFERAWREAVPLSPAWLTHYQRIYESVHRSPRFEPLPLPETPIARIEHEPKIAFTPNAMQIEALARLSELRAEGKDKALVVSATGTGKTLLAVQDVERVRPKRLLFVVHRLQIADEARTVFTQSLSWKVTGGLLGGGERDLDSPYLFASIMTLAKDEVLYSFPPTWFDYIIIDEVHRGGAATYKKVLNHLKPSFLLGMTATPYRTDGQDIFALFDHSLACEITLNQALESNLLAPFHYFGISELTIGGTKREELRDFSRIESEERTTKIVQMVRRYSLGNPRPRGLIFTSRTQEAKALANDLNAMGINSLALTAEDSQQAREDAFASLESEEGLAYLISVDILSEGIDIPSLNQIIILRPTESAIVFVQQLGRGLRKFPGKEYLTVIDFIGNWKNNYLIPIALFGDSTYRKDSLRKLMRRGSAAISGPSTVSFDPIARQQIFSAIDRASFSSKRLLKEAYLAVKGRLGRTPTLMDFIALGAISPLLFLENAGNYYSFKASVETPSVIFIQPEHIKSLNFFGQVLARGIRAQEILLIELLLAFPSGIVMEKIVQEGEARYGIKGSQRSWESALRILSNGFFKEAMRNKFGQISYLEQDGRVIRTTAQFQHFLRNHTYRAELEDLLAVGRHHYLSEFTEHDENELVLYQKYTRRDVVRLLGWSGDDSSTVYGYRVNHELQQCPIFVTYHKDSEKISALTDYRDRFLSADTFIWETKHGRTTQSKEVMAVTSPKMRKLLFVKKSDDEGSLFYYLGELEFKRQAMSTKSDENGKKSPVVMMLLNLHPPLPEELLRYLSEEPIVWDFEPA
ncbi:MAG: DEAD/DEAH box helicase [Sphaerochaeta sp.]